MTATNINNNDENNVMMILSNPNYSSSYSLWYMRISVCVCVCASNISLDLHAAPGLITMMASL